ncbi:hypothetical protein FisN_3Lh201 [Fistulifera solaris]|uniref:Glycosyltransferase subfamily 4-like N-terminal domain-containing protein n=1 Tax=Fistulifera solaris TaxID=1519565 RepID=A0A1Z5JPR1_FISSO|nr:hypothetical protein FisN_3Lh201 [Fistulifera solaris]|eukprot:GAX15761.1 hypothetical protein FisN_3Lh201 [Fistulifera solaris]
MINAANTKTQVKAIAPLVESKAPAISSEIRVLLYTTCYNVIDGVTLTIRKLEEEILAAGHHVCILSTASGDPANTNMDGVHPNRRVVFIDDSVPIPFLHDENNPDLTYHVGFALSRSVRAQIEEFEPSIIHITVPDCTGCHLIQYAREKELPIMGTYHSNIPEYMEHYPGLSWLKIILGRYFRHQYNFLQTLYVPTPYIQKRLVDSYKMDSVTNLGIWGRGVDINSFHPYHRSLKYRHSLGIPDDCPVICWVGRLVSEKRPDIFANVVRRLHSTGVNFHALVIGAGACEDEIKQLPNTTFCGWMNMSELAVAYASSDVFLFPSAVETFGNVTLEAASSGLPVVVEEGCSGHLVSQGVNGFACPEGDSDAFYEATLQLVTDAKLRDACKIASREIAETMEKRSVVRAMLDNYAQVTDQFYIEYGGYHANRDRVYRKPNSFVAGNHPRPLIFVMVEYLTIVLFQVIWNMTNFFMSMQEMMLSFAGFANVSHHIPQQLPFHSVYVSSIEETVGMSTESERSSSSGSPRSSVPSDSQSHQTDGSSPSMSRISSSSLADSTTECNNSISDDELSETEEGVLGHQACAPEFNCARVDGRRFSHGVASVFVTFVEFQCLMESHIRNAVSGCCIPTFKRAVKRKNSSGDLQHLVEDSTHGRPLRSRLDMSGLIQPDGHRLRRQNHHTLESITTV